MRNFILYALKKASLIVVFLFLFTWMVTGIRGSEEEDRKDAERRALEETVKTLEELSGAKREKIANLLGEGKQYYLEGEFQEAVAVFTRVLAKDPENKIARRYVLRAREAFKLEQEQTIRLEKEEYRAVSFKERRIEAQKERLAKFHLQKGERYYSSQKVKLAIKEWEKVLSIQPENIEAQERILRVKHELGEKGREAENEEKASNLIRLGRLYFRQGEYNQAIAEWQKVLNLVPENHPDYTTAESCIHVGEIYKTKQAEKGAAARKDITARSTIVGITESSIRPRRKKWEVEEEISVEGEEPAAGRKLQEKTQQIVSVDFDNAHIRTVLKYLSGLSGLNIVLDESVFPVGEELMPGQTSPRLEIHLNNLPLIQALETILRVKNLVYRIEENLVWITTRERMAMERLQTKVYDLLRAVTGEVTFEMPEGFGEGGESAIEEGIFGEEGEGAEPTAISAESFIDLLKASIPEVAGSVMKFDERTGTLIVRNTPTNLKVLEEIIRKIEAPPMQVSIEARFIAIAAEDLRQLGVEYEYIRVGLGEQGDIDIDRDIGYGIDLPHVSDIGGASLFSEGEGLTSSYTKLNPTEFRMLLDAIEKTNSSKVLSAPKIMTRNLQEAVIRVVEEYRFPDYDAYQEFYYIQWWDINDDGIPDYAFQGVTLVPTSFVVTEVGIILTVTPDIGSDMRTITLTIVPEVRRLGDWVDFETILPIAGTTTSYIRYYRVHWQRIDTQIVVGDGETIVLGGLIEDEEHENVYKVPILGSIPILGRLFRRTVTTSQKNSLLIFITTHLVKPTGERYRG